MYFTTIMKKKNKSELGKQAQKFPESKSRKEQLCEMWKTFLRGLWLAQLVQQATLDFWVVSLNPMLGIEII